MRGRAKSKRRAADLAAPTAERRQHGPVELVSQAIADEEGRPSRPYRSFDTLALMERRGSITAEMRQAGEDFRRLFRAAALDPMRCRDLSRPFVDGGRAVPGTPADQWRRALNGALDALGTPGGSCVWHVVGWEHSLREWALEQGWNGRQVSQETASGILIAALGMLAEYFAREAAEARRRERRSRSKPLRAAQ